MNVLTNIKEKNKSLNPIVVKRGLSDVFYDNTHISSVDNNEGELLYFGYSIDDLINLSNFEEVAYLLLNKRLPNFYELQKFKEQLKNSYLLPEKIIEIIRIMKNAHPIDVLRTTLSALASFNCKTKEVSMDAILTVGVQLIWQIPVIIATHNAIRKNLEPIKPLDNLLHAENFLYMLNGEIPSKNEIKVFNSDLILHAEHGSNASTFTARIVTSTKADIYAAVTAAIGAFSRALHGGALEEVMKMLQELKKPDMVYDYIQKRMEHNLPIFGFGHRIYRAEDPRVVYLRRYAKFLSIDKEKMDMFDILELIKKEMRPYARYGMHVNVDFYGSLVYHLLGMPTDVFVPTLVMSRVVGWIAHVLEQGSNNILIRPRLNCTAVYERPYIAIEMRGGSTEFKKGETIHV